MDKSDNSSDLLRICYRNFTRAKSENELNNILYESIDSLLAGRLFSIFRFNPFDETLTPLVEYCKDLDELALEHYRPEIVGHLMNEMEYVYNSRKYVVIPMKKGQRSVGAIVVKNKLSEEYQLQLEHLGQVWVPCRDRVELENNNAKLASDLARSLHNFSVVRDIADAVSKAMDLRHLLSMILKVAISTVSATRGFIMLENEKIGGLELKVVHGLPNKEAEKKINAGVLKGAVIPLGEGIQGRVMESREPIILTDPMDEEESFPGMENQANSLMCVPLVMNDQAFGVIYVTNSDASDPFDQEDLDVLSILASHASSVLDQARLYDLATTDELTGLHTRRYYTQRIGEEFKRSQRYNRTLSLLIIDIDFFKRCNDTYGHAAGDEVLKTVARLIKMVIRSDVDTAVRFGGEEFVMILPETNLTGAGVVAERIRQAVEREAVHFENHTIHVTLSVGGANYPENTEDLEELFSLADRCLYQSKAKGRNSITLYGQSDSPSS